MKGCLQFTSPTERPTVRPFVVCLPVGLLTQEHMGYSSVKVKLSVALYSCRLFLFAPSSVANIPTRQRVKDFGLPPRTICAFLAAARLPTIGCRQGRLSLCLYLLPFPRYSRKLVENCYTPCIWHPHWG